MIAGSQEYFTARGGGTNDGFLTAIYQDALGRGVDANGRAAFTAALQAGATRGQVAAVIFASPEFAADSVRADYQKFLHRNADNAGLAFFTQAMQQGARDEQVIALILAADEYFARL
jgi:sugar (pentulose or hexulose) kinase